MKYKILFYTEMNKKIIFLPSSSDNNPRDEIYNIDKIINNFLPKLNYPCTFDNDMMSINNNDLINECQNVLNNITKEVWKLLVMKLLMKEKNCEINDYISTVIDKRIETELLLNRNELMFKLFDECMEVNMYNYKTVGLKDGLDEKESIINN